MLASDMKSSPLSPNLLEVCLEAQDLSVQRKASLGHVLRDADLIPPYRSSNRVRSSRRAENQCFLPLRPASLANSRAIIRARTSGGV